MSGIKGATVRNNLNRVVNTVQAGIAECEQAARSAQEIGQAECSRGAAGANCAHQGMRRHLPADAQAFLRGETRQWEALMQSHDKAFAKGSEFLAEAEVRVATFQQLKQQSEARLAQVAQGVESIRRALRGKDWYCDAENEEAKHLRGLAEGILRELRRNVSLGREAQSLRRKGLTAYVESEHLALDADREYERLVNLAHERQERQRIKEENERKAKDLEGDLMSLRQTIEAKNFAKFGASVYTSADRREYDDVVRLIGNKAFEKAIPRAEALCARLAAAAAAIEAAQRAWEAEKLAAERILADARAEAAQVDRGELLAFAGADATDVDGAFASLEKAAEAVCGEDFARAQALAAAGVEKLRQLQETAADNRKLAESRDEMAQAIMGALYEAQFDTPEYYLQDEQDELSDLCVVAAAPGGVGDMKLRIGLAGETRFEVCNIPEGHERLCVEQIRNLQRNLAEADIRFDMTDWGRAERQGREHLDLRCPARQVQKTIQRQG